MRYIKLALLITLAMTLTGCWDDGYHDGDGSGSGGNYDTYWDIVEVVSVEGDVTNMTQKPEAPAPAGDQEECPGVMILVLFILGGLIYLIQRLERSRSGRPLDKSSKRPIITPLPSPILHSEEDTTTLLEHLHDLYFVFPYQFPRCH